ncbi:T9SS type A sorting domain-containing protein [Rhodohalobacter sp. 614A]|uniref:T9SS type A sorting domain-containing protein n=1 Tax=Rhodohalobacter sp. 614A TaxID=2908649 RepID=UPI001F3F3341|nr:T9SS type A sorting domain-containing protein [Rhodohalobacter sp. 614A]
MNYPPFQSVSQSFKQLFVPEKTSVRFTVQIILLIVLFYFLGGLAFSQTIYVDINASGSNNGTSWADAYADLQDALGAATGSNEIWVAEGTYIPGSTRNDHFVISSSQNGLEIYGGFPTGGDSFNNRDWENYETILSGEIQDDNDSSNNSYHVIETIDISTGVIVDGFTITQGNANSSSTFDRYGGGWFNQATTGNTSSPTIRNTVFIENQANYGGGGMINLGMGGVVSPLYENVTFSQNSAASSGGAIYNTAVSGGIASPEYINCTIINNTAPSNGGNGGGVYISLSNGSGLTAFTNCRIAGNSAADGGGLYFLANNGGDGTITITNSLITGNRAAGFGGGMYSTKQSGSLPSHIITNTTFASNHAEGFGSAMMSNGSQDSPRFINSLFYNNTTGGGSNFVFLTNSGGTSYITHSMFQSSYSSLNEGCTNCIDQSGGGNVYETNPQFVDAPLGTAAPTTAGDFSLLITSPAINQGDPSTDFSIFLDDGGEEIDFAGNPRLYDGDPSTDLIDMGAYEVQDEPFTITLTGGEDWRMLSSPIDGFSYEELLEDFWTQGGTGADWSGGTPNIYTWATDQDGNSPIDWAPLTDLTATIPAGSGFLMSVYSDDDYDEDPEGFTKTIQPHGPIRNGNISPNMNSTSGGWSLVGNPYVYPVDFSELNTSGLTGVAYVFDRNYSGSDGGDSNGNTGGWRSSNGSYGDLTDGIIHPAQGFFVQNSGSSGSLTFTEASQTTGGQFYGKEKELQNFVRLELKGEAGYNSAWIRFSSEGANKQIYGDALELQPYSENYTLLGTRKNDGTLLDIAQFSLPEPSTEIPLAVEATIPGTYHLSATDIDLPAGTQFYLHDRQTGQTMLIDESLDYTFTISQAQKSPVSPREMTFKNGPMKAISVQSDRFVISTSMSDKFPNELPGKIALGQNYPNPFNPATVISYQLPATSEVRLEVFDMLGRQVATLVEGSVEAGNHQVNFDAGNLTSGVYLYRLTAHGANGSNQIFTRKLTLIK